VLGRERRRPAHPLDLEVHGVDGFLEPPEALHRPVVHDDLPDLPTAEAPQDQHLVHAVRAASFDPLTLRPDEDVRAISINAWFSLGRHGLGLHFQRNAGCVNEVLVLRRPGRGKVWEVVMDSRTMTRFARLEEAVDAVDFELEQMGRATALSAKHDASWRRAGARADALRLEVWHRFHPRRGPA